MAGSSYNLSLYIGDRKERRANNLSKLILELYNSKLGCYHIKVQLVCGTF